MTSDARLETPMETENPHGNVATMPSLNERNTVYVTKDVDAATGVASTLGWKVFMPAIEETAKST